jgi:C_GCAxxG_C_C family probable redox protein
MDRKHAQAVERAAADFAAGYSCAQALLRAYGAQLGVDAETAARVAASFGGGMARMGLTCGAVTGALMVIGLRYGHTDGKDEERKERTYERAREFMQRFEARNGSLACKELLGRDLSTPEELEAARAEGRFQTRCVPLVREAAQIVGEMLEGEPCEGSKPSQGQTT